VNINASDTTLNEEKARKNANLDDPFPWSNSCIFALTFETIEENVFFPAVDLH